MNRFWRRQRPRLEGGESRLGVSPLQSATIGEPPGRIAPAGELVNTFEFEAMARRSLGEAGYALIAGGDRRAFERITFRPRLMVNATGLNLTATLFGQEMFAPILIAPVAQQKRFHPDGELATMRGVSAAKATMVVAADSSYPLDRIAAEAKTPWWFQIYPEADRNALHARVERAVGLGCKAVCLTLGTSEGEWGWAWADIDRFRKGLGVPLLLKGIMTAEEARAAAERGIGGVIVSNYAGAGGNGTASPMEVLAAISGAVAGKTQILIDGGFRRGGDALKALALGASAVLVARPAMWGLAAYGAEGVQKVVEMLQAELARDMAMCGRVSLKELDNTVVRIHRDRPG